MERKKTEIELPELEAEILQLCVFAESFETIVSECTLETKVSVIGDAVKNLLHLKLLIATNKNQALSWVYDSDRMRESTFRATAKGVAWMEQQLKHKK